MHVLFLSQRLNVLVWKITLDVEYNNTKLGYFKTNKSRCMESPSIFKQICQLWSFPLLHRIPGPSECERVHDCV